MLNLRESVKQNNPLDDSFYDEITSDYSNHSYKTKKKEKKPKHTIQSIKIYLVVVSIIGIISISLYLLLSRNELKKNNIILQNIITELTSSKILMNNQIEELGHYNSQVNMKLSSVENEKKDLIKIANNCQEKIINYEEDIGALNSKVDELSFSIKDLQHANEILKVQLSQLQSIKDEMVHLLSDHKKLSQSYEKALMTNKDLIDNLNKQKDHERESVQNLLGSTIFVSKDQIDNLFSMISPNKIRISLIYKSSIHGDSLASFHNKVDDIHPTIVIIKTEDDEVIGGVTYNQWNNRNKMKFFGILIHNSFKPDSSAFLFNLNRNQKFNVNNPEFAISSTDSVLIQFGNRDLKIPVHFLSEKCTSQFPDKYGDKILQRILVNKSSFMVKEIEMYSFF